MKKKFAFIYDLCYVTLAITVTQLIIIAKHHWSCLKFHFA